MSEDIPYRIENSKELGRYLVAARDIEAREIIIEEEPFISGPSDGKGDTPLCLGCCSKFCLKSGVCNLCSKCYWPVCGPKCEKIACHAENECNVFSANHVVYPPPHKKPILYKSIVILRCLLLKNKNPSKWEQLMTMEDNYQVRKEKPSCCYADKKIIENFQMYFPNGGEFEEFEILKISGIIDTNSHSLQQKTQGVVSTSKCHIYLKTSLLSHCCVPNASWSTGLTSDTISMLTIRSNVPIKKDKVICVSYNDDELMYGTLRRLLPMEISGLFICRCHRCLDPTELGTNLSAIKCRSPECTGDGYLFPIDPVDSFSDWKCNTCQGVQSDLAVMEIIEEVEEEAGFPKDDFLLVADQDIEFLMEFIDNYSGIVVHPNHYVLQEIHVRIITFQMENNLQKLSPTQLKAYIQRCEYLIRISDILTPGFCEYRAFLLFHLSKGLLLLGKGNLKSEEESVRNWREESSEAHFIHVLQIQEEALVYLQENYETHKWLLSLREDIGETKSILSESCNPAALLS